MLWLPELPGWGEGAGWRQSLLTAPQEHASFILRELPPVKGRLTSQTWWSVFHIPDPVPFSILTPAIRQNYSWPGWWPSQHPRMHHSSHIPLFCGCFPSKILASNPIFCSIIHTHLTTSHLCAFPLAPLLVLYWSGFPYDQAKTPCPASSNREQPCPWDTSTLQSLTLAQATFSILHSWQLSTVEEKSKPGTQP